jgi:hypothetical protein
VKEARDGRGAQAILVTQRADHAPLIEGGEGARGGVGHEEQALVLFGCAGPLQDDRDERASAVPPGLQAFEAVDDFVASVGDRHDTDGQQRDVLGDSGGRTWSQRGVAGAQALDGQEAEVSRGLL